VLAIVPLGAMVNLLLGYCMFFQCHFGPTNPEFDMLHCYDMSHCFYMLQCLDMLHIAFVVLQCSSV
jgi:hypothetical protein